MLRRIGAGKTAAKRHEEKMTPNKQARPGRPVH